MEPGILVPFASGALVLVVCGWRMRWVLADYVGCAAFALLAAALWASAVMLDG